VAVHHRYPSRESVIPAGLPPVHLQHVRGNMSNICNVEFYHECSQSARVRTDAALSTAENNNDREYLNDDAEGSPDPETNTSDTDDQFNSAITDDEIRRTIDTPLSTRELLYTEVVVAVGQRKELPRMTWSKFNAGKTCSLVLTKETIQNQTFT
jgi:hypothetical protein